MSKVTDSIKKAYSCLAEEDIKKKIHILDEKEFKKFTKKEPFILLSSSFPDTEDLIKKKGKVSLITSGESFSKEKNLFICKNLNIIGLQAFLFEKKEIMIANSKGVETLNLGEIRDDIRGCEPLLRNSEYVFLNVKSIKHSDYQGSCNPNGFYSEEICQVGHYIGCSKNLKGVFIYNITDNDNPAESNLLAQIIWHIANGIYLNIAENPEDAYKKGRASANFEHKIVEFNNDDNIIFIKSLKSQRMWMEVPIIKNNKTALIPCSEADFQQAIDGNIPFKWLFFYNKCNNL